MKKICNFIKVWIIWTIIGETIASYYKDKDFKEKFDNAKGFDKCKAVFNNLISLNKKLFTEVSSVNYTEKYNAFKENIEGHIDEFNKKLDEIKENMDEYKEEKLSPVLEEIYNKANEVKTKIENEVMDFNERYDLEWKLEIIKEKVSDIKSKIKK